MVAKKKTAKKTKKLVAKKPVKKSVKAAKKPVKKSAKKAAVKKVPVKKTLVVKPVTDSTGVVTMKSVDDPGTATQAEVASVRPQLDKETGVITMVPESD